MVELLARVLVMCKRYNDTKPDRRDGVCFKTELNTNWFKLAQLSNKYQVTDLKPA